MVNVPVLNVVNPSLIPRVSTARAAIGHRHNTASSVAIIVGIIILTLVEIRTRFAVEHLPGSLDK